jgi:hypothetical protein
LTQRAEALSKTGVNIRDISRDQRPELTPQLTSKAAVYARNRSKLSKAGIDIRGQIKVWGRN